MRPSDLAAVADGVLNSMDRALAPVHEKIAALQTAIDHRAANLLRTTEVLIAKELGTIRERVAVLESRPPVPGPEGPQGPPGVDGKDGKDGAPGMTYEGPYTAGKAYSKGHVVNHQGSAWHCNEPTTEARPGDGSAAWTLIVKRGQDGKDAKGAH